MGKLNSKFWKAFVSKPSKLLLIPILLFSLVFIINLFKGYIDKLYLGLLIFHVILFFYFRRKNK